MRMAGCECIWLDVNANVDGGMLTWVWMMECVCGWFDMDLDDGMWIRIVGCGCGR